MPTPPTHAVRCLHEQPLQFTRWLEAEATTSGLRVCSVRQSDANDDESPPERACIGVTEAGGVVMARDTPMSPMMDGGTALAIDGHAFACANDGHCQPLGPQLAAVVGDLQDARVSDDGALVSSDSAKGAWNVAADRHLDFETPPTVSEPYAGGRFDFLGDMVEGSWTPCAGPCTESRIFKRDGTIIADDVTTSTGVLALPGDRLAVMRDGLAIYDAKRAVLAQTIAVVPRGFERVIAQLPGGEGEDSDPMVGLADGRLAVVTRSKTALAIAFVNIERGVVERRVDVAVCTP